ncbi:hypothetical protein PBY51_018887 [Eleginops maclovinus]|uniref:Uncharacterized protein n=1 Tax=Eleginops maclovinus TaxID=56733 RepID=A0AAN7Y174_ELEMC|nr:hypothetical protein PBY51_018887 [Eleginops maclovinus]
MMNACLPASSLCSPVSPSHFNMPPSQCTREGREKARYMFLYRSSTGEDLSPKSPPPHQLHQPQPTQLPCLHRALCCCGGKLLGRGSV